MRISEVNDQETKVQQVKKFAQWAIDHLKIKNEPTIKYSNDLERVKKHRTFGSTKSNGEVWVYIGNRNAADIMRTLVHEFIHVKQFEEGTATNDMDEEQRQFIEDEANALAGRIMRIYGKKDARIYEGAASHLDSIIEQALSQHGIKGTRRV